jgi:hypothetical protein
MAKRLSAVNVCRGKITAQILKEALNPMAELSAVQIARVAREVTGRRWHLEIWNVAKGQTVVADDKSGFLKESWGPDFSLPSDPRDHSVCNRKRSQALALVEWLSDHAKNVHTAWEIIGLVNRKDIEGLMSLALSMMEEKKDG